MKPTIQKPITACTTEEFAMHLGVLPSTVRRAHCLQGHYCGIKPIKLPNRILLWSVDSLEQLLNKTTTEVKVRSPHAN